MTTYNMSIRFQVVSNGYQQIHVFVPPYYIFYVFHIISSRIYLLIQFYFIFYLNYAFRKKEKKNKCKNVSKTYLCLI